MRRFSVVRCLEAGNEKERKEGRATNDEEEEKRTGKRDTEFRRRARAAMTSRRRRFRVYAVFHFLLNTFLSYSSIYLRDCKLPFPENAVPGIHVN